MSNSTIISILGSNEIAREGLKKIFSSENFEVRDSQPDVAAMIASLARANGGGGCHVVIVDNRHFGGGLEACRALAAANSGARLVLLADHYVFNDVAQAFQVGVDAVIIKEISCEPLVESIRLVALGEKVFPSQLANDLDNFAKAPEAGNWRNNALSVGLSEREVDILESVMAGMANKVIARQFEICEATVKVHVKAILRKLSVSNRTQAATWAVMNGVGPYTNAASGSGTKKDRRAPIPPIFGQAA